MHMSADVHVHKDMDICDIQGPPSATTIYGMRLLSPAAANFPWLFTGSSMLYDELQSQKPNKPLREAVRFIPPANLSM